ncbi:ArsR family transcriptional regulator [Sulfodiicoccus acidiphilus]|uniref:ArsR family transcriptional regulator n=1 Tax=Sulfodiicoccus acidiphilus TaxID=1670455 RepID=A0A348B411_9CREN|nr:Lrp/AsnC family transcriptional regulator [Sulfodiicoccus acidiphilus]BBD72913.1 ArsR family transcriptional regulator [Sulfodiicoccus acidiphilus]GGT88054.1 ArsR family transcriptional regulator [Sulfodiicoccus acidiphilus]
MELDELDLRILKAVQEDAKYPLDRLAQALRTPKSTISYRLRRLERIGVIRGYHASINPASLDLDYIVVTLVRTKYGKNYHNELGSRIAQIPGVWGVYFVLGDIDFIVMARYKNREEFMDKYLERIMSMPEIERSSTQVVVNVIKESPHLVL